MVDIREDEHERHMKTALELALKGSGSVSPNPLVGCVIVRDGIVIGKGWHERYGGPHAEVNAVRDAGGDVAGAEVYVNLEPCSHHGKTPPCADLLVEKGVARVIIGVTDPNPKVNGEGAERLRAAGIEVITGVLEDECKRINAGFILRIKENRPFVTLKTASSLDGKIALEDGSSKWITGPESRKLVHAMRAANDAVITGIGTVLADDPQLTVREAAGRTPLRVVLDRELRVPESAKILDVSEGPVLLISGFPASPEKIKRLKQRAVDVEIVDCRPEDEMQAILALLCRKGVNYLMVEAGAGVTGAFISSHKVDKLCLFVAPKIMGRGKCWTDGVKNESMAEVPRLKLTRSFNVGDDLCIEGVFACSPDL